jgi:hypothetical protein
MDLTTLLLGVAAFALIVLVILELMREVVILRSEVRTLSASVATPLTPIVGQRVEQELPFSPSDDWFLMAFVEPECPPCATFTQVASELIDELPELGHRIILIESEPYQSQEGPVPAEVGERSLQRVLAPTLFKDLGISATPTVALIERRDGAWYLAEISTGIDRDWLHTRLREGPSLSDGHLGSVASVRS